MLGVYNLHAIRVKVGSEEESETYAVRATLGGGDRSVRLVKLLMEKLTIYIKCSVSLVGLCQPRWRRGGGMRMDSL